MFSWVAGDGDTNGIEGDCVPDDYEGVTDSIGSIVAEGFSIRSFNTKISDWFMFSSIFIALITDL